MRRGTLSLAFLLALAVFFFVRWHWANEKQPQHNPRDVARVEPSPVTPWRNPKHDLAALFPAATNSVLESRIMSGLLAPLQRQLGRQMHPDENPLRIYRAQGNGGTLGSILVTRVKAEHGGIEIVTGLETNGIVRGVLIQSQREPPAVAGSITNVSWLAGFAGKSVQSNLQIGADLPDVAPEARVSAQAIANAVREQIVVFNFAEMPVEVRESRQHPHH